MILYLVKKFCERFGEEYPVLFTKIRYLMRFKKLPDLASPKDLNEKILWLKLFSDTSQWTELADKVKVRDYIMDCGLEDCLLKCYGNWSKVDEIDFNSLPASFIFKANNGCGKGTNLIVKDKNSLDINKTKKILQTWLDDKHVGSLSVDLHYKGITPMILAEELLPSEDGKNSPIDYKIWCFWGKVFCIRTYSNRDINGAEVMTYDRNWQPISHVNIPNSRYKNGSLVPQPKNLQEMIRVAEVLSQPFPQVRVDLYNINGKIYFGELTFTSHGGMMNNLTPEFLLELGSKADISSIAKIR